MTQPRTAIEMKDVTDAEELTKAQHQRERCDRNAAWLQAHIADVYAQHRGKYICIAKEAIALATTAHPDDDGWFTRFIPKEKVARVYAIER